MANGSPQLPLELKPRHGWGGKREGAGRRRTGKAGVPHRPRSRLNPRHPAHVTLKAVRGLSNPRKKEPYRVIRKALADGKERFGFRLVCFSVQSNHFHLVVEADNETALSRGLQGLQIRLARGLNRLFRRRGRVFADRYHARALATPREVRSALAYVLLNHLHHSYQRREDLSVRGFDPCSSALFFDGWREHRPHPP